MHKVVSSIVTILTAFCSLNIEAVGFIATLNIIGIPLVIPPKIPPLLLVFVLIFPFSK